MKLKYIFISVIFFSMISSAILAQNNKINYNPVVAHRGAWKKNNLPQNSIASLKKAIEIGCIGSEFDVRMTADETLVINHDSDYHGFQIEKTNYNQLISFPLSNGEKLPTLKEYLEAGFENNNYTKLVIEIKPSDISKERALIVAFKVLDVVKKLHGLQKVSFISFDYDILLQIRKLESNAQLQYLEGDKAPANLKEDEINGADFHFSVYHDNPSWVEQCKINHILLNAWTVNEAEEMDWMINNHFDFITTNEPELLFEKCKIISNK